MQKRFRTLRIIAILQKISAVLIALGALIGAVVLFGGAAVAAVERQELQNTPPPAQGIIPDVLGAQDTARTIRETILTISTVSQVVGGISVLVGGVVTALTMWAISEIIGVLIAMEENTRAAASMQQQGRLGS